MAHNFYRSGAPGGEDVVFLQEKKLLEDRGHQVMAYTRSNDEVSLRDPRQVLGVVSELAGSEKAASDISRMIRDFRPQVVHFHNTFPLIGARAYAVAASAGVAVVQTVHNYRLRCAAATHFRAGRVCEVCTSERPWPAVWHRCYAGSRVASWAVARMIRGNSRSGIYEHAVDRFIVLTKFAEQQLLSSGIAASKIIVRPNCLAVDVARLGPGEPRYAVFSGRLSAEKGVAMLLDVWRRLPKLPLKVLGSGPLLSWAQQRAGELGLNVEFVGTLPREQALDVVSHASVLIVPSQWFEGMPLVILEAWALGVPVVGSRIGGIAEMLGADERGIACRPGEVDDFVAAVTRVLDNQEVAEALSAAGREQYLRFHTPSSGAESLEDIYRSVIEDVSYKRAGVGSS